MANFDNYSALSKHTNQNYVVLRKLRREEYLTIKE